jgi:virginiamycin B lyase
VKRRLIAPLLLLAAVAVVGASANTRPPGLTHGQRIRADKLVSQFENSTSKIQYCYIGALDDGRGYTAGRAGFTSATGDLLEVAERYTKAVPDNPLKDLLPRLRELAANGDGSLDGLEKLPQAWRDTCKDPRQRRIQDAVVDELYYDPALKHWRKLGLRRPLSLAAIYDAEIQHGDGEDPDGVPAMLKRATTRAHGTPKRSGISERRFLLAFIHVRRATLAHAHDPSTRAAWAQTVERADVWRQLVETGQWSLASPIRVHTPNYNFTIRKASATAAAPRVREYPVPTASSRPITIALGPDRAMWFSEYGAGKIGRISTKGKVKEFTVPTQNSAPAQIALGPDGALWFAEDNGNKIGRITTKGKIREFPVPTPSSRPTGLVAGPDGALWFTEATGNKVGRIATDGKITEYPIPTGTSYPQGIVAGPDGALWFGEAIGNKIGRITTKGVITEFAIPTPNSASGGLATGPDKAVWFAEFNGDKVGRIATDGTITEYPVPASGSQPDQIAAGPDGALWFSEQGIDKIGRITTKGKLTEIPLPHSKSYASGVASGPGDGALWFTEQAGRIGRIQALSKKALRAHARKACVAERKRIGAKAFARKYGRGKRHRDALGRCVTRRLR